MGFREVGVPFPLASLNPLQANIAAHLSQLGLLAPFRLLLHCNSQPSKGECTKVAWLCSKTYLPGALLCHNMCSSSSWGTCACTINPSWPASLSVMPSVLFGVHLLAVHLHTKVRATACPQACVLQQKSQGLAKAWPFLMLIPQTGYCSSICNSRKGFVRVAVVM